MKIILPIILICLLLNACKKDEVPTSDGLKLSKVTTKDGDSLSTSNFYYDSLDRLKRILLTNNNHHTYDRLFSYDNSGILIKVSFVSTYTNGTNTITTGSGKDSFLYNNGKMTGKFESGAQGSPLGRHKYTYDASGRMTADSFFYNTIDSLQSYTIFTYNANDDLIEWQTNQKFGSWSIGQIIHQNHNNTINPYHSQGLIYYAMDYWDKTPLSKHLVTQVVSPSEINNFSYEYYANGLPRKIFIDSEVIELFYE